MNRLMLDTIDWMSAKSKPQTEVQTLTVTPAENALGLQELLAQRLDVARRAAKRLLDERRVFVNGRRVWMARHLLRPGDRVEVQCPAAQPAQPDLPVLYRDSDYLVLDKPCGRLACGGPDSVEVAIRAQLQAPGLAAAHRLDRDTSGCLLLAVHEEARHAIIELFRRQEIDKKYLALVQGRVAAGKAWEIRAPLEGQPALTRVRALEGNDRASLVELEIATGRTHQIRKHLAQAGHPVVGDKVYLTDRVTDPALRAAPRQMLHAAALGFTSPVSRRPIRATASLPGDFLAMLATLHLNAWADGL